MEDGKCMSCGSCVLPLVLAALGAPWGCTAHLPHPGNTLLSPASTLCPSASWPHPLLLLPLSTLSTPVPFPIPRPHCTVLPDNGELLLPTLMKGGRR